MKPTSMRARARRRNAWAAGMSAGLVIFAAICSALLVSGFATLGSTQKAKAKAKVVKVAKAKKPKTTTAPKPAVAPATTVLTTSTTTTSTTTTTLTPVPTLPPPPPPTIPPPPPTVPPPLPTANATVSDVPSFCTVTVRLSTGAQQIYPLSSYVANPGDLYTFTAAITDYRVDVKVLVASQNGKAACTVSLSNVARL